MKKNYATMVPNYITTHITDKAYTLYYYNLDVKQTILKVNRHKVI